MALGNILSACATRRRKYLACDPPVQMQMLLDPEDTLPHPLARTQRHSEGGTIAEGPHPLHSRPYDQFQHNVAPAQVSMLII